LDTALPPAVVTTSTFCATDFSCPPGQECVNGACTPIRPALRQHIQTASALLRSSLDGAENAWRAAHYDILIGCDQPDAARAINPNARMFEYSLIRFNRFYEGAKTETDWAIAHGYDPEDFYLHYKEDTTIPTWEGRVIVPGFPAGMVPGWNPGGGGKPATALLRSQSRVVGYYAGNPVVLRQYCAPRIETVHGGTHCRLDRRHLVLQHTVRLGAT
jgi:hypothetical protein